MLTGMFANTMLLFAQGAGPQPNAAAGAAAGIGSFVCMGIMMLLALGLSVVIIIGMWKVFEKAGQPGWASLVPGYNTYILVIEICKMEMIWFILMFIPCVGIIPAFMMVFALAEKFGKEAGFAIGMLLLPFIFFPMLGFGDAKYQGRKSKKRRVVEDEYDDDDDDYDDDDYDDYYDDDEDDFDDRPRNRRRRR